MPKSQIEMYIFSCPTCGSYFGAQSLMPMCCPHCGRQSFEFKQHTTKKLRRIPLLTGETVK